MTTLTVLPHPVLTRASWREPMLWLVVGLPAAVVVAGFLTLFIAIAAGGADAIPWEVRRSAQVQDEDLRPDQAAAANGLNGRLQIDAQTGALNLSLEARQLPTDTHLELLLAHPSAAANDLRLALVVAGDGQWRGRLVDAGAGIGAHAWTVQLTDRDGRWRLRGRLRAGADTVQLTPALAQ